ncbi:MAG: hypothetical protein WB760_34545 [Xanthobacteraceae bacterium]
MQVPARRRLPFKERQGDIVGHGHLDLLSGGVVLFLSNRDDFEHAVRQRALKLQRFFGYACDGKQKCIAKAFLATDIEVIVEHYPCISCI